MYFQYLIRIIKIIRLSGANSFYMQNQKHFLQNLIKNAIPGISQKQTNLCLELINTSYTKMFAYLLGLKLQVESTIAIFSFVDKIMKIIRQQEKNCTWVDYSFRVVWLKIKIVKKLNLNDEDMQIFLQSTQKTPFTGNIKQFIKLISEIGNLSQQRKNVIQVIEKQIEEDENYKFLKKMYPAQLQIYKLKKQQQKILQSKLLENMKKNKNKTKNSILDQLLQDHLIRSLQAQLFQRYNSDFKQVTYSQIHYEQFQTQLIKLCQTIKIGSYDLRMELKQQKDINISYYNKILRIRRKIHPIYIPNLNEKINIDNGVVAGKDIIAFMGDTGAGKTTIIQIILGYKLIQFKDSSQLTTLIPVNGLKREHFQFIAKASSQSVTKNVITTKLNLPQNFSHAGEFYIADTPGNNDTRGILQDTANSLTTTKVLSSANSIRFVFVLNEKKWGLRGEGFKSFALQISKLFTQYPQQKAIYILNCFNQEQLHELIVKIKDLKQKGLNNEQKGNFKLVAVVNHFNKLMQKISQEMKNSKINIQYAIKRNQQLILINYKKQDLNQIFQKILSQQRRISPPAQYLISNVSEQARQVLQSQANILQLIAKYFIKQNKIEAGFYYISQLKQISEITKGSNDIAKAAYKIATLTKIFQEQFQKSTQKFKNLSHKVLSLNINEQEVTVAKTQKDYLSKLQIFMKDIAQMAHLSYQNQINTNIQQPTKTGLLQKIRCKEFNQSLVRTVIIYSKHFEPQLIKTLEKSLLITLNQTKTQINNLIKQQSYKQLEILVKKLNQINNLTIIGNFVYQNMSWPQNLNQKIQQRNQKITKILHNQRKALSFRLAQKDVQYLNESLKIFNIEKGQINEINKIYDYYSNRKKQIISLTKQYFQALQKMFDLKSIFNKQKVEKLKKNIKTISFIQSISEQIQQMKQNFTIKLLQTQKQIINQTQIPDQLTSEQNLIKLKLCCKKLIDSQRYLWLANQKQFEQLQRQFTKQKNKLCSLIQSYFQQNIQKLSMNTKITKILMQRFSQACKILNIIKLDKQSNELLGQIQVIYNEKNCLVRQKLEQLFQNSQDLMINLVNYSSKQYSRQNLRKLTTGIINIQRFIKDSVSISSLQYKIISKDKINISIHQINNLISKLYTNLKKKAIDQLNSLIQIIDNLNPNTQNQSLKKQKVRQINQVYHLIKQIINKNELKEIIIQQQDFEIEYKNKQNEIKIIMEKKLQQFIIKKQQLQLAQWFSKTCFALKELDGKYFQDIISQIKNSILHHQKEIFQNSKNIIRQDKTVDYYTLKNAYQAVLRFGQNPMYRKTREQIVEKLKCYVKEIEKQMVKKFNRKNQKQYISRIYDILDFLDTIKQINYILEEGNDQLVPVKKQFIELVEKYAENSLIKIENKIKNILKFEAEKRKAQFEELAQQYQKFLQLLQELPFKELQKLVDEKKKHIGEKQVSDYFKQMVQIEKGLPIQINKYKISTSSTKNQSNIIQSNIAKRSYNQSNIIQSNIAKKSYNQSNIIQSNKKSYIQKKIQNKPQQIQPNIYAQHQFQKQSYVSLNQQNVQKRQTKDDVIHKQQYMIDQQKAKYESEIIIGKSPEQQGQDEFPKKVKSVEQQVQVKHIMQMLKILRTTIILSPIPSMKQNFKIISKQLISVLKQAQQSLFKEKGIRSEFQICFIRNYNSPLDELYTQTSFQSQLDKIGENLKIKKNKFIGGWKSLAFEIPFHKINESKKANQIIIIAGCPGNTKQQVIEKRKFFKQEKWVNLGLEPLNPEEQLKRLKSSFIPIHSLHIDAEQYFQNISKYTGGKSKKWIISQQNAHEQLSNFIHGVIRDSNI